MQTPQILDLLMLAGASYFITKGVQTTKYAKKMPQTNSEEQLLQKKIKDRGVKYFIFGGAFALLVVLRYAGVGS